MFATAMTDTSIDPSSLPLRTAAPDSSVRHFTETLPTALAPDVLWAEFTRALKDSRDAVLWANNVSFIRALNEPLGEGTVLVENVQPTGAPLHYRLMEFSPPNRLRYASLQGHHLAGGATVSVEHAEGKTTLRWQGEYYGTEAQLNGLDRFRAAFFSSLAQQLRKLEAAR